MSGSDDELEYAGEGGYAYDARDEQQQRADSPQGALRSFNTSNVPTLKAIEEYHMKHREDWPMLHRKIIAELGLTFNFVLVNASEISRQQHPDSVVEKAAAHERLWMRAYGPHRQLLEATIYSAIKKSWSGFTAALKYFGPINANTENCAGAIWTKLLEAYPLDDRGTLAILMARELSLVVNPDVRSVDDYNTFCALVDDRRLSLQNTTFTIDELFVCVELAYYYKNPNPHLSKVHISVKRKLEKGLPLTPALVQEKVLHQLERVEAAGPAARNNRTERKAFSTVPDGRSPGCKGCSLHCKDRRGDWRVAPSASDSDGDRARRHIRRSKSERPASQPTYICRNCTWRKFHSQAD